MRALRILLADDHAAVRREIRSLLESETEWRICGEARDGVEAVDMAGLLRPDVVLLDVSMPGLDGLEAARRIRRNLPQAQVVVLTTHAIDAVDEEFRRAGALAVISKPQADRSLVAAIEMVRPRGAPIHLAGSVVDGRRHIAAFFHTEEERYRVLGPFIAEGLHRHDKAVHLIDPPDRRVHFQQLRKHGIDVDQAEARGQLQLVSWEDAYLHGGRFDLNAMLIRVREIVEGGLEEGRPLTRALAHMEWALQDRPGVEHLAEYETRLNDVLEEYDDVVICAYDLTKFPPAIITDVMRGHPAVVIDGSLMKNSVYPGPS